ncbi:hypothetical protein [uncultured Chryseobacterium sp.]|uniref:hypothetical protein n=1 Tax=uncultured Chryseobacterium sp. TaxID=259322 RepID=UPI0027DCB552|nr:hypothetical protein [uncultured Chryseobacterium sp.]
MSNTVGFDFAQPTRIICKPEPKITTKRATPLAERSRSQRQPSFISGQKNFHKDFP